MAGDSSKSAGAERVVDLRSDTVTLPTEEMYRQMADAQLGDDSLDGDPTAIKLEETSAEILGKDAALFVSSCTMANLIAALTRSGQGDQTIVDEQSHIYTAERASCTITNSFYLPAPAQDGQIDCGWLDRTLASKQSYLKTSMIAIETTHNNAGGLVLPIEHMQEVRRISTRHGVALHLDGARLFNAAAYLNVSVADLAVHVDSVAICLSKGLSAPVGAILAGDREMIADARRYRKMLGGQQRQAGIMAAAGLEAVRHMPGRLHEDHRRAALLSEKLNSMVPHISASSPQTNILQLDVSKTGVSASDWASQLARQGVLTRVWGDTLLRLVTHRHISDSDVEYVANAVASALSALLEQAKLSRTSA